MSNSNYVLNKKDTPLNGKTVSRFAFSSTLIAVEEIDGLSVKTVGRRSSYRHKRIQWGVFVLATINSVPYFYCQQGIYVTIFYAISILGAVCSWISYFLRISNPEKRK
mgnify:CR=1 FL=1